MKIGIMNFCILEQKYSGTKCYTCLLYVGICISIFIVFKKKSLLLFCSRFGSLCVFNRTTIHLSHLSVVSRQTGDSWGISKTTNKSSQMNPILP